MMVEVRQVTYLSPPSPPRVDGVFYVQKEHAERAYKQGELVLDVNGGFYETIRGTALWVFGHHSFTRKKPSDLVKVGEAAGQQALNNGFNDQDEIVNDMRRM